MPTPSRRMHLHLSFPIISLLLSSPLLETSFLPSNQFTGVKNVRLSVRDSVSENVHFGGVKVLKNSNMLWVSSSKVKQPSKMGTCGVELWASSTSKHLGDVEHTQIHETTVFRIVDISTLNEMRRKSEAANDLYRVFAVVGAGRGEGERGAGSRWARNRWVGICEECWVNMYSVRNHKLAGIKVPPLWWLRAQAGSLPRQEWKCTQALESVHPRSTSPPYDDHVAASLHPTSQPNFIAILFLSNHIWVIDYRNFIKKLEESYKTKDHLDNWPIV